MLTWVKPPAVPNKAVEDGSCTQLLLSAATDRCSYHCTQLLLSAATDRCSYHLPTPRLRSVDHDEAVLHNANPM